MYTFQDFNADQETVAAKIQKIIKEHTASLDYRIAVDADTYDHQQNSTIMKFIKILYSVDGRAITDPIAANNRICSNFFHRLNTQRTTYSLGNGIEFNTNGLKEKLGLDFDKVIKDAAYYALMHKMSFIFWNFDKIHMFKYTEFAPVFDEESGAIRAGVRFWQVEQNRPVYAVLYEEDGFTKFKGSCRSTEFVEIEPKRAYKQTYRVNSNDEREIIGEGENYGGILPIIPLYGTKLKQSTLVGMKSKIDAFDMVNSGFANDLQEVSEIFWIVYGAGGMNTSDLAKFRDRLKILKFAVADSEQEIRPYKNEIPTDARTTFLQAMHNQIYEDFGALDVHSVQAGSTNDHLEAAYQPMDEEADEFEFEIISAVQKILKFVGAEDTPIFKRNRISNQKEQTEMIIEAAAYLDDETILKKLPWLTPDEIEKIIKRKAAEDMERLIGLEIPEDEEDLDE